MTTPADDTLRMEPQDALRVLLESDGFRLLVEEVRREWGNAAQLRKIRAALESTPAAEHSVVTQSIIATAEAIFKLFAWPEEEYERLSEKAKTPKAPADRFAEHRRVG